MAHHSDLNVPLIGNSVQPTAPPLATVDPSATFQVHVHVPAQSQYGNGSYTAVSARQQGFGGAPSYTHDASAATQPPPDYATSIDSTKVPSNGAEYESAVESVGAITDPDSKTPSAPTLAQVTDVESIPPPAYDHDVGCVHGLKRSMHWKSLILTLALFIVILVRILAAAGVFGTPGEGVDRPGIFAAMFLPFYIIYLIECACSGTAGYVKNKTGDATSLATAIRNSPPIITWHVQCYHYETRLRTRMVSDPHTNTSRMETYHETVRVNTHSASMDYAIVGWFDASGPWVPPTYENERLSSHVHIPLYTPMCMNYHEEHPPTHNFLVSWFHLSAYWLNRHVAPLDSLLPPSHE
eukprot:m.186978 g.186978  ORF g.186978 m.186978 type:complete len:353 (-) comp14767_c2_seq7:1180-2238(-)